MSSALYQVEGKEYSVFSTDITQIELLPTSGRQTGRVRIPSGGTVVRAVNLEQFFPFPSDWLTSSFADDVKSRGQWSLVLAKSFPSHRSMVCDLRARYIPHLSYFIMTIVTGLNPA
jgi:hypothetical protein